MRHVTFDDLARLPLMQYYEAAFRKATGVSLTLAPPHQSVRRVSFGGGENPFCRFVSRTAAGCEACRELEARLQRSAARKLTPQQMYCYAGLTIVAVPVLLDGRHVATLLSGQVFRREPTQRDFALVAKMLAGGLDGEWEKKMRRAYFETPVVTVERLQAIIELLKVFAQYLADHAGRAVMAAGREEPPAVAHAKQFVQAHAEEPMTLPLVAKHVHVSPFYFCKLFKKTTGMTLTEYVARVRVEKAKTLLVDPSARVSEIVYAAGFGSIPRFNSVFKRYVGMAPTQYRATLRTQLPL